MGTRGRFAAGCFAAFACALVGVGCGGSSPNALPLGDDDSGGGGDGTTGDDASQAVFETDSSSSAVPLADAGCATAMAQAKRQPVYLLFVLDSSDSMKQENKWAAVVPALQSIFDQMQTSADPGVAAGLIMFPNPSGHYPGPTDVPIGYVSAAQDTAFRTRLADGVSLGTPTDAALTGGYGELETYVAKAPVLAKGKKVLVLLTDGVPTDQCSTLGGLTSYASNPCVELASAKLEEGAPGPIETFVIGVGDFPSKNTGDFDPGFLGSVAQAGGTGPAGCNPTEGASTADLCYFEIDPSQSTTASDLQKNFETALDAIRGQVVSCTFPLESTNLGALDPTLVNVDVGGAAILQDPKNGWTYDDPSAPTEIVLHGAACTTATADLSASVSIVVGCKTEVVK